MYQIIESFHIISINTKYYIITYRKYPLVIQLQYYKDERRGCDRTMFAVFGAPYTEYSVPLKLKITWNISTKYHSALLC